MKREKVVIIGAGIVGLAHAWSAAERGYDVTVFERSSRASGGSIRNFGMIWPIGQPTGDLFATAMRSQARWRRLGEEAGIWVNPAGSIHLAHRADEWTVLQEFASLPAVANEARGLRLLTADEVHQHTRLANPEGLLGGLFSPTELGVNPREAVHTIPKWLSEKFGVQFNFDTHIVGIESDGEAGTEIRVSTSQGYSISVRRAVLCCGAETRSLFPSVLQQSGIVRCKLQMLSVETAGTEWHPGPHLASGLTLRHYQNFDACGSIRKLRARIAEETPELDRFGIHVMASQDNHGRIILGDSHEYGDAIEPFDKALVDDLILRELRKVIRLPNWDVTQRWHGIYAKHPSKPAVELNPLPNVHIVTGTGGAGMTMSFGLAEQMWDRWQS
ncbi:MAG: TIGR03364 family FAD-dependent oxidoreductase [Planctomyces sp.]|jgi:FAD dependent oxidoreductase TIGR03364